MQEETQPTDPTPLERTRPSRAQRRRAQRRKRALPTSAEGRSALLQDLVARAYPSYEFFVFAIFAGAILGLGYLLDSQAILVFGILMAPLMSPLVGMTLGIVSGSGSYFLRSMLAFGVGSLLVFATGALAGLAARLWLPLTFTQAFLHARLWWADLAVLALGTMLLTASFVRSEKKPFLPSVIVAYELFLPLNAAAFGLASQVSGIFLEGILVFAVHLAWTLLFGALTLFFLGFRPVKMLGWLFSLLMVGALLFALGNLMLTGTNQTLTNGAQPTSTSVAAVLAEELPESTADSAPVPTSTSKPSSTPEPESTATPSRTPTVGITLDPTETPTQTLTPEPTPLYARIFSSVGGGAYIRREPNGPVIITLANDELVQAISEPIDYEGIDWVQVRVVRNDQTFEGWIMQQLLQTATPAPTW
jgi:hypothetical protein